MLKWIRRLVSALAWRLRCFWAAHAAGTRSRAALKSRPLQRVLVVCYGNIYRSPYTAELLRKAVAGVSEVRSSGLHPVADRPSPPQLVAMSSQSGVDLAGHRSSTVTTADLAWADAIILMDRHNWQALCKLGAEPQSLIWLGTLDGGGEIPDPYGMPEDQARKIMHRVHQCTEALAAAILARRNSTAA